MKPIFTHTLNERVYTAVHPLAQELCFETAKPLVFDLSYLSILDVEGNTASSYLQGQLSCHLDEVTSEQMRPGAQCNLQGRIMSLLDVVDWQGLHLVLPGDLCAATQASLSKSALFSRVSLKENNDIHVLGVYLPKEMALQDIGFPVPTTQWGVVQDQQYCCYAISDTLKMILCRPEQKQSLVARFSVEQQRGSLAWHALELEVPRFSIYPNTRGLFLPHRLGLQHTAYISFNKGCYKGQEIIARTHYRAKLKHTVKSFILSTQDTIYAGQKIYADLQQAEIGEVIDYCPLGSQSYRVLLSILMEHPCEIYFEKGINPVILT